MSLAFPLQDVLLQFTFAAALVLLVQFAFTRLNVPGLVGLLVVGMLVGPGGMGFVPREPVVELFGALGLLFIMFLAGLEVDLDVIRTHRREVAAFGLFAFAFSLLPAVAAGLLLGFGWAGALLLGAALASHTLLAYPIVERLRLIRYRPVVTTIGGTLITDTLALILLAVVVQRVADAGSELAWSVPLALLAGLVALSLLLVPRLGRYLIADARLRPAEKALFLLVVLLLLSTAAEAIGTEAILGAFLAGVCFNRLVQQHVDLRVHIEFVGRMLFIPFFFVETGMRLELSVLAGSVHVWTLAGLFFAVVLVGKTAAAWLTGARFGYPLDARALMGSLALPQAAATLAVAVTAREAGLFSAEVVDPIVIVIFVTCLLGPLVTRAAGERYARRRAAQEEGSEG